VSSPKLTGEVCLEGNGEGLQALVHVLLINSETYFKKKKKQNLKLPALLPN